MSKEPRISVDDLVNSIGAACQVLGLKARYVSSVSPIAEADSESVAFCNKKGAEGLQMIRDSGAGVIICHDDLQITSHDLSGRTLLLVANPRLAFIRIMQAYYVQKVKAGISPAAVIDEMAVIHPPVYIGPNSYVGACEIGQNTVIHGSVHIYPGTRIGQRVLIQAGAVIGAEGQTFESNERGELERFPQIGGVIIEDNAEIGSNTSIMRGPMANTIIGAGTKIGHLCNIGHGVIIGKHCRIISMAMIGGSSRIGDYTHVKLGACIRNKVKVGENVVVGMGAVVTKDVGDGKVVFGVPARERDRLGR